jgi:hypothetical protein
MNAKPLIKMSLFVLLLSPVWVAAQVMIWYPLPDLAPVDVNVESGCRIVVTLTNNGPGIVPNAAYVGPSTGIQMYVDGAPWGGIALGALDTAHLTQPAGGTVTAEWFPNLPLPVGAHNVTLQVDNNNQVAESNELNNVMTKTLTCTPPAPDLVPVSLTVNSQCQLVVTLMNVGTAPIPDANFAQSGSDSSAIQMYNDGQPFGGITLGALDLTKQVQPVGGTVTYTWFPGLKIFGGPHLVTVVADNNNSIIELNEANNSLTQNLSCFRRVWPPIIGDPPTTIKP